MSGFIIHSIPGSPFARAVMMVLEEKSLGYRLSPIEPGTLQSPSHLARHPFGKMPVLDHGQYRLYETQAILRYLDRVAPAPSLTPENPQAAGLMDQLLNINDWYLFQGAARAIVFHRIIGPRLLGLQPDEGAIAATMPAAHLVFDELARQLGDRDFFVAASITLADLTLAPQLDLFSATPEWEPLTARHDNLRAWLARMNERRSMAATTWEKVAAMAGRPP